MVSSTFFIKVYKVFKVNIWWTIKCNLLNLSFVWNFHNELVCLTYSNTLWYSRITLCDQNNINIQFFSSITHLSYYRIKCFTVKHISNHIIKYDQYFGFYIWILIFNILQTSSISFENSIKALESLKHFMSAPSHLLISNWYFASRRFLAYNWILSIFCWRFIKLGN